MGVFSALILSPSSFPRGGDRKIFEIGTAARKFVPQEIFPPLRGMHPFWEVGIGGVFCESFLVQWGLLEFYNF